MVHFQFSYLVRIIWREEKVSYRLIIGSEKVWGEIKILPPTTKRSKLAKKVWGEIKILPPTTKRPNFWKSLFPTRMNMNP